MPEVELKVADRSYRLVCDAGQEQHLLELGRQVDAEARRFAAQSAASNEAQLLLMSALTLADQLTEARASPAADPEIARQIARLEHLLSSQG